MTYEVDFAETDPEYRRLFAALGTPEQWSTFTHAWDDLIRQAEQAGIPAEKFAGMFAWALGAMIGGQPPGKKQDEILRDAWSTCMHGANHAGMDTMAWMERMKRRIRTMTVIEEIAAERQRQIDAEGWTLEHDDEHGNGEMAQAAGVYAMFATDDPSHAQAVKISSGGKHAPNDWPWDPEWFKPKSRRRDLIRAAALIVAEIERLDRAAMSSDRDTEGTDNA